MSNLIVKFVNGDEIWLVNGNTYVLVVNPLDKVVNGRILKEKQIVISEKKAKLLMSLNYPLVNSLGK